MNTSSNYFFTWRAQKKTRNNWFLGLNLAEFLKRFLSPRRWCPLSSVILLPSCSFGLPILRQIFFSWAYKTDSHSTLLASISQSLSCLLHGTPHISLDNICMIVHVVSADCCFQEKISMGFFFFYSLLSTEIGKRNLSMNSPTIEEY